MNATNFAVPGIQTEIVLDTRKFKTALRGVKKNATEEAEKISKSMSSKLMEAGKGLKELGSKLTKTVTLPIVGMGTAAFMMAKNFDQQLGNIKTLFDGTAKEVDKKTKDISSHIKRLSKATNVPLKDVADGAYQVISAFGDTKEVPKQLEATLKAAKAGGASAVDSLNLLSAVTKGYGDTSFEAMMKVSDLAFQTVKLGQTTFPELASSIGRVAPIANVLKVSQEELFGVMATATGVTGGAAEVSTQLREVLKSLMSPTKDMRDLMKQLNFENGEAMVQSLGFQGALDKIVEAAKKSGKPLQNYIGSIEGQTLALTLAGEQHDVLTEKTKKMTKAVGSTEEAYRRVSEGQGEKFAKALNDIKVNLVEAGEKLLPFAIKASEYVAKLADKFSKLSPETQKAAIKALAFAAALGPFLKISGGVIKGIGAVGKVMGALSGKAALGTGGAKGLATALGAKGLVAAAGIGAIAVAGVGLAAYGTYKYLSQDVVPAVNLFSDAWVGASNKMAKWDAEDTKGKFIKISEATKNAVGAYMELDRSVGQTLYNIKIQHTTMSDEIAKEIGNAFDKSSEMIITKQKENYDKGKEFLKTFFEEQKLMTKDEQAKILENLDNHYKDEKTKVEDGVKQIKNILETASKEKRALTEDEQKTIDKIREGMRDTAIRTLSETEEEANVIRERLKNSQERISAEEASALLTNAKKVHDEEIAKAEDKYTQIIKEANRMKDARVITEKQYEKMVEAAENQRKESIEKANDALEGIKKSIETHNPNIWSAVDKQTGGIKSRFQKLKEELGTIMRDIGNMVTRSLSDVESDIKKKMNDISELNKVSGVHTGHRPGASHYNGLDYVPYDGYTARLHKGERVLTAKENQNYGKSTINNYNITSPQPLSPYEIAREVYKANRRFVLGDL